MAGITFVLAACLDGPMIFSRLDYTLVQGATIGVGASLLAKGEHDQYEIDTLISLTVGRRVLRGDGIVVLDCGANVGCHLLSWAKAMDGWGEIIGIEAQERVFYALAGNIALNNLFNARALWAAVSDTEGFMQSAVVDYQKPAHFSGMSLLSRHNGLVGQEVAYSNPVRTITIDGMKLARLDVLKIDVEGMEPEALAGARVAIARDLPIISAEWTTCGELAIGSVLAPLGYKMQKFGGNLLCMHRDDPLWAQIKFANEKAA